MRFNTYEHWVRVAFHLNGGFLRVEFTNELGVRLNMPTFDLPTQKIPLHLRSIGSRFLVRWKSILFDEDDHVDDYRDVLADWFEVIPDA